jgi:5,10-methylenetetrahydromethanopterin reductase
MLRLAGQIADGVIIARYTRCGDVLASMLTAVQQGRAESGRAQDPFVVYLAPAVAVHDEREQALAAVRPHVARALLDPKWPLSPRAAAVSQAMAASYNVYEHMGPNARHARVIPDEVVSEFAIAGTADECIKQVQELMETPVDEITIRPYATDGGSRSAMIEAFARDVMWPVRKLYA